MAAHHPRKIGDAANKVLVATTRAWLLEGAEVGNAAEWSEQLVNQINHRLNSAADPSHPQRLNFASSIVARALIARGLLRVAAQWLADETDMKPELALAALTTFMDDLPPELESEIVRDEPQVVQ